MKLTLQLFIKTNAAILGLILLAATLPIHAVEIVRLQIDYDGITHPMDIELFDDEAPLTVANYLDYVTSTSTTTARDSDGNVVCIIEKPKYDGTFIYRNEPGFVLQTGGFTFRPCDPSVDYLLHPAFNPPEGSFVARFVQNGVLSPVSNESMLSSKSNLRGTISMALIANQPDSGTTEWFINLDDNVGLDASNFTVFGEVIDDGMDIADEISTFPRREFAGIALGNVFNISDEIFLNLPVVNYVVENSFPPVLNENLVIITTVRQIERPIVRLSPPNVNFSLDVVDNQEKVIAVTVKNTGNEAATVGQINTADLSPPFSIKSEDCSDTTLEPVSVNAASTCSISYSFLPTVVGEFADSILITYTSDIDAEAFGVTVNLSGEGVPTTPVLTASDSAIDFEDTVINAVSPDLTVTIRNKGGASLLIDNPLTITGSNNTEFNINDDNCSGVSLPMGDTCDISIQFAPLNTEGSKTAALSITSNAGDLDVILTGTSVIPVIDTNASRTVKAQLGFTGLKRNRVTNIGTGVLEIISATITDSPGGAVSTIFTQTNNCPGISNVGFESEILTTDVFCSFEIFFTPVDETPRSAILTIVTNDPITPITEIIINGEIDIPELSVDTIFDVGTAQINGNSSTKELIVSNSGQTPLFISNITGLDASNFTYTTTCIDVDDVSLELPPESETTCSIFITFTTDTIGTESIVLNIESNDPLNPVINVTLNGFGDNDSDGVISSVEDAAPNGGDANNDEIADNLQNDVASLLAKNGQYITFVSDESFVIKDTTALADVKLTDTPGNEPDSATFNYGLFSHSITVPANDGTNVGIFISPEHTPTKFYKFGPTINNPTPHWYDFAYDTTTQTGAQFFGKVTLQSPSGAEVKKNFIIVSYVDGRRGDDDLIANGIILSNTSGLSFTKPSKSSSGALSYPAALLMVLMLSLARRYYRR